MSKIQHSGRFFTKNLRFCARSVAPQGPCVQSRNLAESSSKNSACAIFSTKGINKYTWIRVANGRVIERALMDYVLITKRMVGRLKDVHVFRGVAAGMSDHFLVEAEMVVAKGWGNRVVGCRREVVKVEELRWLGHVERMDNERLLKKVMNAKVDGRSARRRPRFGWMDGVKRALNDRRMDIREASERARNRNEWRMIVTQF